MVIESNKAPYILYTVYSGGETSFCYSQLFHDAFCCPCRTFSWIYDSAFSVKAWFFSQNIFCTLICTKPVVYSLNFELSSWCKRQQYTSFYCGSSIELFISFSLIFFFFARAQKSSTLLSKSICLWTYLFNTHTRTHIHVQPSLPLYPQRDSDQSARPRSCVM